ncbi:MAG: TIR domain-containing protein, partial [Pseudomonadota bacterium]
MADVFISYARPDRGWIDQLAAALTAEGLDVWWDRNLTGGSDFSAELEVQLNAARTVLVAWSKSSVQSNWVADEATEGRDRGCLVPISIDGERPKLGFRQFQTLPLQDWNGDREAPEFQALVATIKAKMDGTAPPVMMTATTTSSPSRSPAIGLAVVALIGVAALVAVLAFRSDRQETSPASAIANSADRTVTETAAQSIAILPFADMSAEKNQAFFSEGVAEEILNVLARVDRLKVASRTSSFRYRNRVDLDARTIASELAVRHLLDGSVRKAGDNVRVTVRLVDGPSDRTLWSRTFDQVLSVENLLSIQDDIATSVVEELGGRIGIGSADTLRFAAAAATDDLLAYEVFLEGRDLFSRRQTENLQAIVAKFEEAVRLDPDFSREWEALAAAYSVSPGWGLEDRPYATLAVDAANRALALRQDLALARAVLGANATYEGAPDYVRSIDEYGRAIELDPDDPVPWSWRGQEFAELGFFDDAERDLRRALELDPADSVAKMWLGRTFFYAGKLESALNTFLELDDEARHISLVYPLALALAANGEQKLLEELRSRTPGPGLDAAFVDDLVVDPDFDVEKGYAGFRKMLADSYGLGPSLPTLAEWLHSYKRYSEILVRRRTRGETVWWYRY